MARMPTWTILGGGYQSYLKGDYQAAYDEWLPLAELGDAEAQFNLGVMYDEGAGIDQSYVTAANWYRKAANQGFLDAQTNLGMMYYEGLGIPRDLAAAAEWFRRATSQGDHEAAGYLKLIEKELSAGKTQTVA
jgi:TPR repeat protein